MLSSRCHVRFERYRNGVRSNVKKEGRRVSVNMRARVRPNGAPDACHPSSKERKHTAQRRHRALTSGARC